MIFQIENKEDTGCITEEGERARLALLDFARSFQERNPQFRVFGCYLHMDEATPHLHIDFVPYTMGSMRGLDTRVSMKQALASRGFIGKGKENTECNQWIESEKEELAKLAEKYGIIWRQEERLHRVTNMKDTIQQYSGEFYKPAEELLPEADFLESAKNYRENKAKPKFAKLQNLLYSAYRALLEVKEKFQKLENRYSILERFNHSLSETNQAGSVKFTTLPDCEVY